MCYTKEASFPMERGRQYMPDVEKTERIGVYACAQTFEKSDFIFREQQIADYGIDALIEAKEDGLATGKMIAIQIKSGESYFKEQEGDNIVFHVDEKHRNYWINHSLPVIIVLYSPEKNECIWEIVNRETLIFVEKRWKIRIPTNQTIDNSMAKLLKIAENMSDYEHRYASLVLAKEWMMEARNQGALILEVEEWINKSSGRGRFVLKSCDDDEKEKILFDHELWGFGLKPYDQVIRELFPWANAEIDRDYYDENMEWEDTLNWDIYDEDNIIPQRELPDGIYPYCNAAGEVDCYRLLLTLNHVGEAFLTTEEFLEEGMFYCIDQIT